LPAGIETTISTLEVGGKSVDEVFAPQSVTIQLADDIDISRGDSIVKSDNQPQVSNELDVILCWMDDKPLIPGNKYYLQHGSRLVRSVVKQIEYKLDVNSLQQQPVEGNVKLNEVVKAVIKTASPLVFDSYDRLNENGSAVLIDETSNSTVAAVLIK
jgi:sulfate adenylyltransferase subunit 1